MDSLDDKHVSYTLSYLHRITLTHTTWRWRWRWFHHPKLAEWLAMLHQRAPWNVWRPECRSHHGGQTWHTPHVDQPEVCQFPHWFQYAFKPGQLGRSVTIRIFPAAGSGPRCPNSPCAWSLSEGCGLLFLCHAMGNVDTCIHFYPLANYLSFPWTFL